MVFSPSGILTLLTDFGTEDPFVGVMRGVIAAISPDIRVIDLTHGIRAQDVDQGAFWLERSFRWFPAGTVHVAVVDPGVGTDRGMVVMEASGHAFVAPDNGLLARVAAGDPESRVFAIDLQRLGLPAPSATFHGRDVFSPVGARVAAGQLVPGAVGPPQADWARPEPAAAAAQPSGAACAGTVMAVDHFGNLITDIEESGLAQLSDAVVEIGGKVWPLVRTYAERRPGEVLGLINSFGTLEVAVVNGSASKQLGVGRGAGVVVRAKSQSVPRV